MRCMSASRPKRSCLQAKKMAMLGQMSAKISHEISQPLTAVRALATNSRAFLAQEKWSRVDANLGDIADYIAARMSNITRQLKVFSGRTKKVATPYRSNAAESGHAGRQAPAAGTLRARGRQRCHCLSTNATCWADAGQLEQVFVNLFANALRMPLRQAMRKHIGVTVEQPPGAPRVVVRVRDSGPGAFPRKCRRIFSNRSTPASRLARDWGWDSSFVPALCASMADSCAPRTVRLVQNSSSIWSGRFAGQSGGAVNA